jgi:hypothetical protein
MIQVILKVFVVSVHLVIPEVDVKHVIITNINFDFV